jgi:hypothetical protein
MSHLLSSKKQNPELQNTGVKNEILSNIKESIEEDEEDKKEMEIIQKIVEEEQI